MNHSYISVPQLVEKLKTNGFIDDNFYAVSVDFDDFQVAEGKFGKFVNVKVLNVSTLTKDYKTLSDINFECIAEMFGTNFWLNLGTRFLKDTKNWKLVKSLNTIKIDVMNKKEFKTKDGVMRGYYEMYRVERVDPDNKILKKLQHLREVGKCVYVNKLVKNINEDNELDDFDELEN